jgi:hypothetical protein
MSSYEQTFLVALRNKFESKKTGNIYLREQYNELLVTSCHMYYLTTYNPDHEMKRSGGI